MRNVLIASAVAAATLMGATAVSAREDSGKRFRVTLQGEVEVPTPGDLDGTGTATIRINPGQRQLCYTLTVRDIAPATAAHIHEAMAGSPGPVLFGLMAPTNGMSQGCITITREQAMELIRNPSNYYINVHNAEFTGGALRGQLGM